MSIKELMYLLWYSVKNFFIDLGEMFAELKNPKTWSYLTVVAMFFSVYLKHIEWLYFLVPFFLSIKIIRHNLEGNFKHELYQKELIDRQDTNRVRNKYNDYVTKCEFNKYTPLSFEEWREKEIRSLKNNTDMD